MSHQEKYKVEKFKIISSKIPEQDKKKLLFKNWFTYVKKSLGKSE